LPLKKWAENLPSSLVGFIQLASHLRDRRRFWSSGVANESDIGNDFEGEEQPQKLFGAHM
jgi:hypothetical protein